MTYYEWKKSLINDYQKMNLDEMKQFGIEKIDDDTDIGKKLVCANIFGTNDNNLLQNMMVSDETKAIIIGFGGNSNLHLGHLLLTNELNFYLKNLKSVKLYFVNFDIDDDKNFVYKIKKIIDNNVFNINYEIVDYKNLEALKLKKKIMQSLNINTVNRVMGWNNMDLQSYEKMLDMLTTFSLGSILKEQQSIVITDINQKTYYALYKQIEKKVKNNSICFVYHMLMPSLKSPIERMSIKKPKSLIYLDEQIDTIENKLRKSYSGLDDKEISCSILRVADLVLTEDETTVLVNNCIENNDYCKKCKDNNLENISNEIVRKKIR